MDDRNASRAGVLYALAAFGWWGFVAGYFKAVGHVPAVEVLAHRIVWSLVLLGGLILARGRGRAFRALFRDRVAVLTLCGTTVLIAVNWLTFIWAVTHDRLLEASLGYFINPLMNVLLGFVFLRERLRRLQAAAVGFAGLAVLWLAVGLGALPWVSLVLAGTFGLYGLLRKIVRADGTLGLAAETLLLLVPALAWFVHQERGPGLAFLHEGVGTALLLAAGGVVTALPLIWFAEAARRLRYATLGFLQYLAPTLQFLLAVVVFHEPFSGGRALAFVLIWSALGLYSWDTLKHNR